MKMNKENLLKLATYLDTLPAKYEAFEMNSFFRGFHCTWVAPEVEAKYARENGGVGACGAVACAVGHGPSAGLYVPESCFYITGRVDWDAYTDLMFLPIRADGDEIGERLFDWMFSGQWSEYDNTPRGAAKRIRYAVANDGPPDDFDGDSSFYDYVELYQDS